MFFFFLFSQQLYAYDLATNIKTYPIHHFVLNSANAKFHQKCIQKFIQKSLKVERVAIFHCIFHRDSAFRTTFFYLIQ